MLLGTRLWYGFFGGMLEDAKFEETIDELCKALGDPSRAGAASSAAPKSAPAPAPALAPAPAPAPTPAPVAAAAEARTVRATALAAPASTPDRSFTPSARLPIYDPSHAGGGGARLSEVATFLQAEREEARKERQEMKAEAKAERQALEARLEAQRQEAKQEKAAADARLETLRAELTPKPPAPLINAEQLVELQQRLEFMGEALTGAEREWLEDLVSDYLLFLAGTSDGVVTARDAANPVVAELKRLVVLADHIHNDIQFARQARRTFSKVGAAPQLPSTPITAADPLEAWLEAQNLSEYSKAMRDEGYSSMRFLHASSQEDLEEMAAEIKMKKVHAKVLVASWRELVEDRA